MLVKDAMTRRVMTADPGMGLKEAARTLADNRIGSLVVLKGGKIIGILTERDILLSFAGSGSDELASKRVEDAMTNYIITTTPGSSLNAAVKLMTENRIKKLPVLDGDRLAGMITATDIIMAQPRMIKDIKRLMRREGEE